MSKCCNNKRSSEHIIPLFYIDGAIQYFENGKINCDERYFNTIKTLNLEHITLQLFRRCWLNLPSNYDALDVIDASTNKKLREQIIDDMDLSLISIQDKATMSNEMYWKLFVDYFWFYLYKTNSISRNNLGTNN